MATLSQAKLFGGVGSILIFIPFVSVVGYILLILAVRDIAGYLSDRSIFNNMLVAALTGIVGALAGAFVIVVGVLGSSPVGSGEVLGLGAGLLVAWIFLVLSAVFLRRTYDVIGNRLGVSMFRTAATLYVVGAALAIIVIGFLLLFVAQIVQAIAYFSIPDVTPPQVSGAPPAPVVPVPASTTAEGGSSVTKFCTSCGTKISPTATFCYSCGAKQA